MRYAVGLMVSVSVVVGAARGFEPPVARSYTKPTPDGKHLLVMLVPPGVRNVPDDDLRKRYGKSGLYANGDPAKPRWTCNWYVQYESGVMASNDGVYVVRVPDRRPNWRRGVDPKYRTPAKPPGVENWAAVLIYKNGEPFRTLTLKALFDCSRFTDADCDGGPVCEIDGFFDDAGRVGVRTTAGGERLLTAVQFRSGEVTTDSAAAPPLESRVGGDSGVDGVPSPNVAEMSPSWGRVAGIGAAVVGACSAVFLTLAVVLVRTQRVR